MLCIAKKTINKDNQWKENPQNGKKIFANEITDKGVISKAYKHLTQLYVKKSKQTNGQKIDRRSKQTFSKKDIQMASKYMKKCSKSLITREMQIKTTMKNSLTHSQNGHDHKVYKQEMLERV